jgi:hypothetical protein
MQLLLVYFKEVGSADITILKSQFLLIKVLQVRSSAQNVTLFQPLSILLKISEVAEAIINLISTW